MLLTLVLLFVTATARFGPPPNLRHLVTSELSPPVIMPVSTSSDGQFSQAQSFADPLSPAAAWLASFSPMSDPAMHGFSCEGGEISKDFGPDEAPLSPAAQYLTRFSSPPPLQTRAAQLPSVEIAGYRLGESIGKGISQVRLATSVATGAVVAVKIVLHAHAHPGSAPQSARSMNEEHIWKTLNHEHILPLLSVLHTTEMTAFFTLYCPDGSLLDLVEKRRQMGGDGGLEGDLVRSIFRQIIRGIAYLHNTMHVLHGDVKLENILIDDNGNVRIADFGCAQYIGGFTDTVDNPDNAAGMAPQASQIVNRDMLPILDPAAAARNAHSPRDQDAIIYASLPYAAPELLRRPSSLQQHHFRNPARDIWALGCVLHALLTGSLPFADTYEPRLYMKIFKGDWESQSSTVDGDRVVLRGCLCVDPINRWTINKVEAHAHEIGAAAYTRLQRRAETPHSRVCHVQRYLSTSSSRERLQEHHSSRDRYHSTVRAVSAERIDIPTRVVRNDVYPTAYRMRTPSITDDGSVDSTSCRVRRALCSESRDAGSASEVLTPPNDTFLPSLSPLNHIRRSGSRGRLSRERQVDTVSISPETSFYSQAVKH